jgi:esterase/lipase superfamily enzyme
MFFMISDRDKSKTGLGKDHGPVTYWTAATGPLDRLGSWKEVSQTVFSSQLLKQADKFPAIVDPADQEDQKHVTFFVHGYNNSWADAARRYQSICDALFSGSESLGACLFFTWPSDDMKLGYLPDRMDARKAAPDLADVLSHLYDHLLTMQAVAAEQPKKACKAKTSVIAHSMGNYVFQKAMQLVWTRKNRPLLVSLLNQVLMVAADVDNDLFKSGEDVDGSDGDAIANLSYRITALYSGRDSVLGMSAGLKHFGKRRLGRSGIDRSQPTPDNVWDIDCSSHFGPDQQNIHSAYFEEPRTIELMRQLLRGVDRNVLRAAGFVPEPLAGVEKGALAEAGLTPASPAPK